MKFFARIRNPTLIQRHGRLSDPPLEGNDFNPNDMSGAAAQDSVRIFHQSSFRPDSGTGGERKPDGLGPGLKSDLRAAQSIFWHESLAPLRNDLNTPTIETPTRRVRPPVLTSVLWDAKTRLHQIVPPPTCYREPTNQRHNRMMNRLL